MIFYMQYSDIKGLITYKSYEQWILLTGFSFSGYAETSSIIGNVANRIVNVQLPNISVQINDIMAMPQFMACFAKGSSSQATIYCLHGNMLESGIGGALEKAANWLESGDSTPGLFMKIILTDAMIVSLKNSSPIIVSDYKTDLKDYKSIVMDMQITASCMSTKVIPLEIDGKEGSPLSCEVNWATGEVNDANGMTGMQKVKAALAMKGVKV